MERKTLQEILDFSIVKLGSKVNITVLDVIELVLVFLISFLVSILRLISRGFSAVTQ